jgi:hypothetical protein
MPNEQMLKHGVDAFVFLTVQFRIFVKRHVSGPSNFLHLAEHVDRLAFQSVEFRAHTFHSGGWRFYGPGFSNTRVILYPAD